MEMSCWRWKRSGGGILKKELEGKERGGFFCGGFLGLGVFWFGGGRWKRRVLVGVRTGEWLWKGGIDLKDEKDLRGFDAKKGWIHATAHTADLLAALAKHPSFTQQDQGNLLKAIGQRIETAHVIFAFGEQDRLASAIAAMAERQDFVEAGFLEGAAPEEGTGWGGL